MGNIIAFKNNLLESSLAQGLSFLSQPLAIKNPQGHYVAANKAFAQLSGFDDPNDLLGLTDESRQCPSAALHSIFMEQDQRTLEVQSLKCIDINFYAHSPQLHAFMTDKQSLTLSDGRQGILLIMTEIPLKVINHIFNTSDLLDTNQICSSYQMSEPDEDHGCLSIKLSQRQNETLFYLLRGYSHKMIAQQMGISVRTVEDHLHALKLKFSCYSTGQLIERMHQLGYSRVIPHHLMQLIL